MASRTFTALAATGALALTGVGAAPAPAQSGYGAGYQQPAYPNDDRDDAMPPPPAYGAQPDPRYPNRSAPGYADPGYDSRRDGGRDDGRDHDGRYDGDQGENAQGYDAQGYSSQTYGDQGYGRGSYDHDGGREGNVAAGEDVAADRCAATAERRARATDASAHVEDVNDVSPDYRGWRVRGILAGNGDRSRRSFECVVGGERVASVTYGAWVPAR